ncbi:protein involved in polysaccharide export, contains SLBB domain of the beta-grasp fold [Alkalispirochaeta americana]|uniref:Protein involved in polysaccharide export, contains SLBB domain of the beta-grasp fold n=1 Tax=Alkalispirochaeta americana TaxID=159291 RepID=A0A1N6RTD4_9SPIO|nr:SLBB domain-containing protein [Alkalispirochaeta americana]SIQ32124.1 protein involved in polysaccharide export, contains SLBB domain of the beta-grasp fold [Alkalispirochaeta americana]
MLRDNTTRTTRSTILAALMFLLCVGLCVSQDASGAAPGADSQDASQLRRVTLATTDPAYPATPGDIYRVRFMPGSQTVSLDVVVQSDLTVELGVVGSFSARNMLYSELRAEIRRRINAAYPGSQPTVQIHATGLFQVPVTGEVSGAYRYEAWGLSRLSQVISGRTTDRASLRAVEVISSDGSSSRYDLFRAQRFGEQDQDPLIRPGDQVVLHRAERIVTLGGEVQRSGRYELLAGEDLEELIHRYGDGPTPAADLEQTRIIRTDPQPGEPSRTLQADLKDLARRDQPFPLEDGDQVTLFAKDAFLPVAFFEGAVQGTQESDPGTQPGYARYPHRFRPGTLLSQAVRATADRFLPSADLSRAYVMRTMAQGGEVITVNLEELLYQRTPAADMELKTGDRIVLPFRQNFVIVSGAVHAPGRYPYVPGRTYEYYMAQAGGTDRNRHMGDRPKIRTVDGSRRNKSDEIQPEDTIHFSTNSVFFFVGPIATIVSTATSIVLLYLNLSD